MLNQRLQEHALADYNWVQIMTAVPIGLVQPAHHLPIQIEACRRPLAAGAWVRKGSASLSIRSSAMMMPPSAARSRIWKDLEAQGIVKPRQAQD